MIGIFRRSWITRAVKFAAYIVVALSGAGSAHAQYLDARLIPRGALRIDFSPHYTNYNLRFSFGTPGVADGTAEPLGTDLTVDTAGSNIFPTFSDAENAVRSLTGDAAYRLNVGKFLTIRDADVRHFPFGFALGVSQRLTVRLNIPIVTTRSQVTFTSDTTDANVGWNLANENYGNETTAADAAALISQLSAAISEIEAMITAGDFGCPSGPGCDQARGIVMRATTLLGNLFALTGLGADAEAVAFAPLETSAAGAAVLAEIAAVALELQALGASPVTGTLPLPTGRLSADAINDTLLCGPDCPHFAALPIGFNRQTRFGDIEIGAWFGLLMNATTRAVLTTTVRLPTGRPSSADNFVDIGTGDGQTDVELGIEAAFEPGNSVGLSFGASYTLQLAHSLVRRVTTPDAPLVPVSHRFLVKRDLGNVIRFSAYPTVRLSSVFRVFGSVHYFRKGRDSFSYPSLSPAGGLDLALLEVETEMRALSYGGGIAYRSDQTSRGRTLPIEAGLNYRAAFSGSGGLTPKTNSMQLYLRLFFQAFGP